MAGKERGDKPVEGTNSLESVASRPPDDPERVRMALMAELDVIQDIPETWEWRYNLDQRLPDGTTPRECLDRFDPERANLPAMTGEQARHYIGEHRASRPWLEAAADRCEAVQRVFAALDLGSGHALERHEGFADDDKLRRRVGRLEDPAQLDPIKRAAGIDGCRPGDQPHTCSHLATALDDADAFAALLARGMEHPDVERVLESEYDPGQFSPRVSVPITPLLGLEGCQHCRGYRLRTVGGSLHAAISRRSAWIQGRAESRPPAVPEPVVDAVGSFEGGRVDFVFRRAATGDRYELSTMFVKP